MATGNLLQTYIVGYDRAIRETVEQKGGKMRSYVQKATGDLFRKEGIYQRTTSTGLPSAVTNRFGDSPVSDIEYSRRKVTRNQYHDGQFMDWADLSKMGVDPRNVKLNAMKNKFLRQEDLLIDAAALGTAASNTSAQSGDTFSTTAFGAGHTDVTNVFEAGIVDIDVGASTSGFNYDKFLTTIAQFGAVGVDLDSQKLCIKVSWNQWRDIMDDANFTDFEKKAVRGASVLEHDAGHIYEYMGVHFIISNILPYGSAADTDTAAEINVDLDADVNAAGIWQDTDSTAIRLPYAFVQDAILFEVNPDITTKVSERADKSFNYYAYCKGEFGAVRMEEEKVIAIACKENA